MFYFVSAKYQVVTFVDICIKGRTSCLPEKIVYVCDLTF